MHYKRAVEQKTRQTHDQIQAKEEEINTATFTRGGYATLCRGDTSKVLSGVCRISFDDGAGVWNAALA